MRIEESMWIYLGYVWEDDIGKGKLSERNGLRGDENDRPVKGVPVTLKNKVTQKEETHYTDEDGKYIFKKILINDLENMYINFTYNGMCYGGVPHKIREENGSKASEGAARAYMDSRYSEVSNSKAEGTMPWGENVKTDLKYDYNKETHMSHLNYECTDSERTYGGAEYPVTNVPSKYIITASTTYAYMEYDNNHRPMLGYLDKIKTPEEIRKGDITEVTNINLGLYKREQPDISVVKDIESAKVQINNRTHVYKYSDRFSKNNEDKFIYGDGHDVAVKFGQKYGDMSYTRALYASDIKHEGDDKLSVNVTYRIQIANQSSSLKVIVNQLADYYDTKYEVIDIGTQINSNGDIIESIGYEKGDYNLDYKKSLINLSSIEIEAGHKLNVYVQMRVKSEEIIKLVDNSDEYVKLDNIAEIISYKTMYEKGGVYGGVDKDSNPGNTVPGKRETYEDDTDSAPGLKLVLQSPRTISGKVFLDDSGDISIVNSGNIRQGDGKYTNGEDGIPNVTVRLKKGNDIVQRYDAEDNIFKNAECTTASDGENKGNYSFEGIIPDNYYLEFTWGDKTYRVQDYKSTIVDEESAEAKASNKEWYKDEFKKQYDNNHYANQENYIAQWDNSNNTEYRTSDAIDDYSRRDNIDKQTKYIINSNKNAIDSYYENTESTEIPMIKVKGVDGTEQEEQLITEMNSNTNEFNVNIEYNGQNTTTSDEYQTNPDGTIKVENGYAIKKPEFANAIKSIDFGITRRAKQQISIEKRINSVKLKLANGQVIVDAKKEENGNLKGEMKHTTYIKPDNNTMPRNGFLKLELDNELIQGSVLEVEYEIKAVNTSEVDYATSEFYNYGKGHGQDNIITIKPTSIIDYLDKGWMYDNNSTTENGWEVKQETDIKSYIESGENKAYESIGDQIILITDKLKNESLTPIGDKTNASVCLKASKTLSTTEEITLDNETETVILEKSGGSNIESTPGNYIPGKGPHVESDDDMGEQVIVTPSTGKNLSYIEPITIGITALIILGTGIVLIKKRVLNKKED
ncbi:MAG: hypothetical protein HFJ40_05675 [Clostridia bacterium]|nr:hypothetical protein [Clostridia bacterium]